MKKILTIITLAAMIMVAGCVDLDDILRRLDASESKLAEQGRELATMKSLVDAMDKKIGVQSYKELADKSGYELTMSDGSKITLKHGAKGEQGEKGEQGNPGQDGDANLTITEVGDVIIIVYKGVTYTLPKGEAPVRMTLTTAKNVGEKITLRINAAADDQPDIWIDLNNNDKKDEGEAVTVFGSDVDYLLGAQTVTVYGKVTYLRCTYNQLTSLDVSHNTALTQLYCYRNQLTSLDVSKNTALTLLSCDSNQLTTLNVSNNTALMHLYCHTNQLASLDVSNNTKLTDLRCYDNQLTSLDVSINTSLTRLWCYINKISGDNMTALVNSLPTRTAGYEGSFQVINLTNPNEQNKCTTTQVGIATGKNWKVLNSSGNPYPGSD